LHAEHLNSFEQEEEIHVDAEPFEISLSAGGIC
jgi:hypothetical protein